MCVLLKLQPSHLAHEDFQALQIPGLPFMQLLGAML